MHRRYEVSEVAYDPAYFQRSADELNDDGLSMISYPASPARMVPACQRAFELIADRTIAHNGSPLLATHIHAAIPSAAGDGWRITKNTPRNDITAATAFIVLCNRASTKPDTPDTQPPFIVYA